MYNFKKNKETGKFELVRNDFNVHSSVIAKKAFDDAFSREFARFEYFGLLAKYNNDNANSEDMEKIALLESAFGFDSMAIDHTVLNDFHAELVPLLTITLFAHGKLLESYTKDKNDEYRIKCVNISLGLRDFYIKAKEVVDALESGKTTLEEGVKVMEPLYNNACTIINHDAKEGVCKKWVESTKQHKTRAFLLGLTKKYKLTRYGKIKGESPLKSLEAFEKYFALWLTSEGLMVDDKKKVKSTETFDSFVGRLSANAKTEEPKKSNKKK